MGNQQGVNDMESVTTTDWAWLAGMLNGDGCFSMKVRKRDNRWKCDLSITLTQTDPCLIEKAVAILTLGIQVNPSIQEYPPSGAGTNAKFNLRITKMDSMKRIIEQIDPYMAGVKQAKCRLILRYINNRIQYEGMSKRKHTIESDPIALRTVVDFCHLSNTDVPNEIVHALRDYPQAGVGTSVPKCVALA